MGHSSASQQVADNTGNRMQFDQGCSTVDPEALSTESFLQKLACYE